MDIQRTKLPTFYRVTAGELSDRSDVFSRRVDTRCIYSQCSRYILRFTLWRVGILREKKRKIKDRWAEKGGNILDAKLLRIATILSLKAAVSSLKKINAGGL